jgi:hypothetical protein
LHELAEKLTYVNEKLVEFMKRWKQSQRNNYAHTVFDKLDTLVRRSERDKISPRLLKLYELSNECLIYVLFRLKKYDECFYALEYSQFLIDSVLIDSNQTNEQQDELYSIEYLRQLINQNATSLIKYKSCECLAKFAGSKLDVILRRLELHLNELIKKNLINIEHQDFKIEFTNQLNKVRNEAKQKETRLSNYINKTEQASSTREETIRIESSEFIEEVYATFYKLLCWPIEAELSRLDITRFLTVCIDEKYMKMCSFVFNCMRLQKLWKLSQAAFVADSFSFYALKAQRSADMSNRDEIERESVRQKLLNRTSSRQKQVINYAEVNLVSSLNL